MDPRRCQVERNAHFTRGPRFFRHGDGVLFEFIIDASNVVGPRPARIGDVRTHGDEFKAFVREHGPCSQDEMQALGFERVPDSGAAERPLRIPVEFDEPQLAGAEHHQGQPAKRAYRRKSLPDEAA